jgi:hypothetical protein
MESSVTLLDIGTNGFVCTQSEWRWNQLGDAVAG